MTDNWDFYALRVDDEPASIFVDLGIAAEAPVASLPHMAYVRVFMNLPRPDGLSSSEEFEDLVNLEDALQSGLCAADVAFVGRNTSGGCRDFYFYTSAPAQWPDRVFSVMAAFDGYKYEFGSREDAGWSTYFDFLMPGERDRQRIENRRVCDALERNGDKLVLEREIDHWSYFPSESARDAYLQEVAALGFKLRDRAVSGEGSLRHGVRVWRSDIPSYDNIDDVTLPLFEAAANHGGQYDGWECPVET